MANQFGSRFSAATLAELAERIPDSYSHAELDLLLKRLDAVGADEDEWGNHGNKLHRSMALVESLVVRR